MPNRRRSSPLLVLILMATLAVGCGEKLSQPEPVTDQGAVPEELADLAPQAASIEVAADGAESGAAAVPGHFTATGELRSPMESRVTVRVAGRVAEVFAEEGEIVHRGEPLLRLETDYAQLELERARADLQNAEATLAGATREATRKQELFDRGSVPTATLDKATTAREQAAASVEYARAVLATAKRRLGDATLLAPFTGVVVSRQAAVGAFVDEKSAAMVLAQTEPLRLRFDIPERLFREVHRGQEITAKLDAYPGETFRGTVSVIGQSVDPESRSVFAEAEMANAEGRLKPGMFARVDLDLGPDPKLDPERE